MQIFTASQRLKLLEYMAILKYRLSEWLYVEINILDHAKSDNDCGSVAALLCKLFEKHEGCILICGASEVIMLIEWGKDNQPNKLTKEIETHLPADVCEMKVALPTKEGLKRIALSIDMVQLEDGSLYGQRAVRPENVFLVADDDMYIRLLAKKALQELGPVFEIGEGNQVAEAYKSHNPDLVLLDIHMPGIEGEVVLDRLKEMDPKAYIVMLSADSSLENVTLTKKHGAKGFLAKPLNKARLLEWVDACPTIRK